jgi:hypothetical protein
MKIARKSNDNKCMCILNEFLLDALKMICFKIKSSFNVKEYCTKRDINPRAIWPLRLLFIMAHAFKLCIQTLFIYSSYIFILYLRDLIQHTGQEDSDEEPDQDLPEAMEQSPEDAGYSPTHTPTVEGGENLDSLFEYTLPDWVVTDNDRHPIEDEASLESVV